MLPPNSTMRIRLQRLEVKVKYPLDLGDRVGVEEGFVTEADDRFGFRAIKMAARVGDDAVVSRLPRADIYLADNAVKGNRRRNLCQGHKHRAVGRKRVDGTELSFLQRPCEEGVYLIEVIFHQSPEGLLDFAICPIEALAEASDPIAGNRAAAVWHRNQNGAADTVFALEQ